MRKIFIAIIAALLLACLFGIGIKFIYREKMPEGQAGRLFLLPVDADQSRRINYEIFDGLLHKYVSGGLVDYINWRKNDFMIFDKYIRSLKYVELNDLGLKERKAFWINAYNALTIYAVLRRIPENRLLAGSFSVRAIPGFFDKIKYEAAGEKVTLNDIENRKLRAGFGDARIHFAIVCASMSCPKIQASIFKPHELDVKLNEAARVFIRDSSRNRLDRENGVLYLSEIFRWFREDFVKDSGSLASFAAKFLDKGDSGYLLSRRVEVKYLFYNWFLNIKKQSRKGG